jgi:hypothetical protein
VDGLDPFVLRAFNPFLPLWVFLMLWMLLRFGLWFGVGIDIGFDE